MNSQPDQSYNDLVQMLGAEQDDQLINVVGENPHLLQSTALETGETILHEAAYIGRLATVKKLLDLGASIEQIGNPKRTPLHYAAIGGHCDVVAEFIKRGAHTEVKDANGMTPLMYAAISGPDRERIVNLLLSNGAKLDLDTAVRMEKIDEVRSVIQTDPDWVGHLPCPGDALAVVIAKKKLGLLNLLLDHGIQPDSNDEAGTTALFRACSDGSIPIEIVSSLLEHGADPNRRVGQQSPVERAKQVGREDVIALLHSFGATG
jgi:ankyrin repeat protein